jgi:hypothetical protein
LRFFTHVLVLTKNEVLRTIINAPWYVPNTLLHTDLQIPTVKAEITNFSFEYREKLATHPNELTPALLEEEETRRLTHWHTQPAVRRAEPSMPLLLILALCQ